MDKLKKIISLLILVPLGIVLIVLAVANRQMAILALNPFRPEDSVLSVSAPFFVFLFLAVLIGMVIGSAATWWSQGKYRKQARAEAREAVKWQKEHQAVLAGRPGSQQLPAK
ncbi:putative integral membrane protein [Rhizobium petrolearium]|uniref:LapA family protein n=1 Tax=Neorhizobium petrolearium TaxID=515361 RepID=UPI001AE278BF|nr:LapA family protein [Neorhizobium petrolearium]MBP1841887.1 putative integral membrane protein [Neorhizobium petrolearium]